MYNPVIRHIGINKLHHDPHSYSMLWLTPIQTDPAHRQSHAHQEHGYAKPTLKKKRKGNQIKYKVVFKVSRKKEKQCYSTGNGLTGNRTKATRHDMENEDLE